jgi:hypothetical protein
MKLDNRGNAYCVVVKWTPTRLVPPKNRPQQELVKHNEVVKAHRGWKNRVGPEKDAVGRKFVRLPATNKSLAILIDQGKLNLC